MRSLAKTCRSIPHSIIYGGGRSRSSPIQAPRGLRGSRTGQPRAKRLRPPTRRQSRTPADASSMRRSIPNAVKVRLLATTPEPIATPPIGEVGLAESLVCLPQSLRKDPHHLQRKIRRLTDKKQELLFRDRDQLHVGDGDRGRAARLVVNQPSRQKWCRVKAR